jgi:hypothetical protein
MAQGDQSGSWPYLAWVLYFCLPAIGVGFLAFGIIASDKKIASIHIVATDSAIIMALLALPLYLLLGAVQRKKHARSPRKREKDAA